MQHRSPDNKMILKHTIDFSFVEDFGALHYSFIELRNYIDEALT